MSPTPTTTPTRVTSADGTRIAVLVSGSGRPLVIVPGTSSDHASWDLVLPHLTPRASVHVVDRRGRGASGDSPAYAIEGEYADVAAVVDAAATAYGGPVDVLGHSYGGNLAFGAAALTDNVRRLALYEGWPPPDPALRTVPEDVLGRLESLLAEERREEALLTFFREVVLVTEDEVARLRAAPTWERKIPIAPTLPREMRAFGRCRFDPAVAHGICLPVLLLVGEHTPAAMLSHPEVVADALPDARIEVLPGQTHMAHMTDPQGLAETVLRFLAD